MKSIRFSASGPGTTAAVAAAEQSGECGGGGGVGFYLSADERGTAAAASGRGEGGGGRLQEKNEKKKINVGPDHILCVCVCERVFFNIIFFPSSLHSHTRTYTYYTRKCNDASTETDLVHARYTWYRYGTYMYIPLLRPLHTPMCITPTTSPECTIITRCKPIYRIQRLPRCSCVRM